MPPKRGQKTSIHITDNLPFQNPILIEPSLSDLMRKQGPGCLTPMTIGGVPGPPQHITQARVPVGPIKRVPFLLHPFLWARKEKDGAAGIHTAFWYMSHEMLKACRSLGHRPWVIK